MTKQNRKGRNKYRPFVMLRHDMLKSPAYLSLMPPERAVYVEILHRFKGTNNGDIALSCREAAQLCNISNTTASRAFKTLQGRGFIKVGRAAGFNLKNRTSTRWIVTHEAIDGKIAPSNEWQSWKPDSKNSEHGFTRGTYSFTTGTVTPKMIPEHNPTVSPEAL